MDYNASSSESSFDALSATAHEKGIEIVVEKDEPHNVDVEIEPVAAAAVADAASMSADGDEDEDEGDDLTLTVSARRAANTESFTPVFGEAEDFEAEDADLYDDEEEDQDEAQAESDEAAEYENKTAPSAATFFSCESKKEPLNDWKPVEQELIAVDDKKFNDEDFDETEDALAAFASKAPSVPQRSASPPRNTEPLDLLLEKEPVRQTTENQFLSGAFVNACDPKQIMATVASVIHSSDERYKYAQTLLRASTCALQEMRVSLALDDSESLCQALQSVSKVRVPASKQSLQQTLKMYTGASVNSKLAEDLKQVMRAKRTPYVDVSHACKEQNVRAQSLLKALASVAHVCCATLYCAESEPAYKAWAGTCVRAAMSHVNSFDALHSDSLTRAAWHQHVEAETSKTAQPKRFSRFERIAMMNEEIS